MADLTQRKLDLIIGLLVRILGEENIEMSVLDDLKAAEQADAAATAAAVEEIATLSANVGTLSTQLNDAIAANDPAAIAAAAAAIQQHATDLQTAVTAATTPSAP